jgi:hypothetical protein
MFANGAGFSRAVLLCDGDDSKGAFLFSVFGFDRDHADRSAMTTIG